MLGLRSKILLGFSGLLLILIAVSLLGSGLLRRYSDETQRMLRDDLAGVEAAQEMKDSVDALELQRQGAANGKPIDPSEARASISKFDAALRLQGKGSTLPAERQATDDLEMQWRLYRDAYEGLMADGTAAVAATGAAEFSSHADRIRALARVIALLNLDNMRSGHGEAAAASRAARFAMHALTVCGVVAAAVFAFVLARTILRPVKALTESVHQVEQGNLDLTVPVNSRDELGRLAHAFNDMAAQLRVFRRIDHEKLIRTQETTQRAIDSLPDAVILVDPQGRVELANETAKHLLAVAPQLDLPAMAAARVEELRRAEPARAGAPDGGTRPLPKPPPAHAPRGFESIVRVSDGDGERSFLPKPVPIRDRDGALIGLTIVLADVTDLKRLDEMKNNLLSLVAHELKTPLTSMRMVLHLLVEGRIGTLSDKQHELVVAARDDSDRLHQIIENLMDMARIESGRVLMETRPVRVEDLVLSAIEPMRPAFAEHGVSLGVDLSAGAPAAAVMADPTRVGHVFANLLTNALKYTQPGGDVRVGARESAGGVVEFWVSDDGAGIPRQFLGRVFEKFFRAPGQPGDTGTGLGLAIVKDIIEAHGGRVSVESEQGRGTTIRFTLPAAPSAAPSAASVAPAGWNGGGVAGRSGEGKAGTDETGDLAGHGRESRLAFDERGRQPAGTPATNDSGTN